MTNIAYDIVNLNGGSTLTYNSIFNESSKDSLSVILLAFALSQVFIIGRFVLKFVRLGSEASFLKEQS